jgi:hypothetical protein
MWDGKLVEFVDCRDRDPKGVRLESSAVLVDGKQAFSRKHTVDTVLGGGPSESPEDVAARKTIMDHICERKSQAASAEAAKNYIFARIDSALSNPENAVTARIGNGTVEAKLGSEELGQLKVAIGKILRACPEGVFSEIRSGAWTAEIPGVVAMKMSHSFFTRVDSLTFQLGGSEYTFSPAKQGRNEFFRALAEGVGPEISAKCRRAYSPD